MTEQSFETVKVWQKAHAFTLDIHRQLVPFLPARKNASEMGAFSRQRRLLYRRKTSVMRSPVAGICTLSALRLRRSAFSTTSSVVWYRSMAGMAETPLRLRGEVMVKV